ncbi:hypothetical protein K501DRAFT_182022 [Backusella circina FSU 941]|nr:hypothetical protein K501DRAFT_182022 [Backusella circina FSU 941]
MKFDDAEADKPEPKKRTHKEPTVEKNKKPKLAEKKKAATPITAFDGKNKKGFIPYIQKGADGRPLKKVYPQKKKTKLSDLSEEEIKKKVAAIRQKKRDKKRGKVVDASGNVVKKPILEIYPKEFNQVLTTKKMGEFIIYSLAETENFKWCKLINKNVVEHVVMVFCQGINVGHFGLNSNKTKIPTSVDLEALSAEVTGKAAMPFLSRTSKYMIVNKISGKEGRVLSPVADILQCPMTNSKKLLMEQKVHDKKIKYKDNMREYYVLTLEEMKRADYPIPPFLDQSKELPEGWKETHAASEPSEKKRLIAVDCEMVLTEEGSALARLTLINEEGDIILDQIVKPDSPVTDYLTKYSGITPETLGSATCSLRRAQKYFRKMVDHNVILVGHGLENDLRAMKIAHPYCVDTSLIFDHIRGPPYKPSLRVLARSHLGLVIQDRNDGVHIGHDSSEDARATLDLFKLKLKKDPSFGKFQKVELIFERLEDFRPSRSSAILESVINGSRNGLFGSTLGDDYFKVESDDQLVDLTLEKIKEKNFLFTRYQTLEKKESEANDDGVPSVLPSDTQAEKEKEVAKLQKMDEYIRRVYAGLPSNSILMVSGGPMDIPKYRELILKRKAYFEKYGNNAKNVPEDERWTGEMKKDLEKYADQSRSSASFIMLKD